ncbi:type II/IV secretion system protein [bacterium]|nr:type II/IV secretion system protein [bacterium]
MENNNNPETTNLNDPPANSNQNPAPVASIPAEEPNSAYIKINLASYLIEDKIIKSVPGSLIKKYFFMPVFKIGNTLTIATTDPENISFLDSISKALDIEIEALYADAEDIQNAINQHYGMLDLIENFVSQAEKDKNIINKITDDTKFNVSTELEQMTDSSIINLVNLIISQAVLKRASDIHIEPMETEILIRIRIDGEMSEMKKIPITLLSSIVSRIKIMSGMDIAENRQPQDGHIRMTIDNQELELRVSSLPMIHGENVVIRLLPKRINLFTLKDLGFSDEDFAQFETLIQAPYGIILVTGPTGSGKTTTLYAALNKVNKINKNIITLEDPVESQLHLVRQVQTNEKAGLTFASGLRSMLRQDPDIIMVGEIRDQETAELAVRASLTGHLVFSTLHTNDAPSSLIRLIDMGIKPFLVSSSVIGVMAQRLVRQICPKCKAPYKPTKEEINFLNLDPQKQYFYGKGCKTCEKSGYLGRIGIFELLILNEKLKHILIKTASALELRNLAIEQGLKTMQQDGIKKIYQGITTPEEVLKVTQFLEKI